ncbi:Ger(x)C family spore germination protein [Desulfosporosinus sp. BICA1-9]|uniref:Ger(x)C family spore germination protein n=1 Tax=Desulfosporosinus sp. BICA1-9 TaxID=1531958 RepID=UPI00054C33F9|nr:Ger(x)C family spore germination protein [Desulfosporosinus sp. BICA1-9]KJS49106.1 MAG: spore gernimation protein GerC [Peptococcaceae bacterium BRH_c23]KJS81499.1 MAG: spore gernimation protein GerC [Desulfosporosinus sp. BICA1-9]HBW35227.1 Ger(x)C family spore germination protein [Desulfosporosinus sp.]
MKRRILILITSILLLAMLTGCWNRRELTALSIVQAMGIDRTENNEISLTFQLLLPGELKVKGGGGKGVSIVTSTGETLFDALRNAALESDRKLYGGHIKVVVIGEEAAKAGIIPLLDFARRDHEWRELPYFFIARGGTAKDIIKGEHEQEKIPAKAMESLAKATKATSKLPKVNLHEVLKTLSSKTTDMIAPGIQVIEKKIDNKTKKIIELDETAIFKKDKLVGWFDWTETRGLLWILGEVKSGIIVVESPKDEKKKVSLEILRASSKVKPEITDGKLMITVEVKEEGNLGEQMSQVYLTKPDTFKELEEKQAAAIEDEINSALRKAQAWGVDIFQFGEAFHRKFPKEWPELKENWDEEFKKLEVTVEVDANLRGVGISTAPAIAAEEE